MTANDDETVTEHLAQVRAQRRHLDRLRVAERRDALDEDAAQLASEREAQQQHNDAQSEAMTPEASRTVLLAEEATLALEQSSLVADRDLGDDFGIDL